MPEVPDFGEIGLAAQLSGVFQRPATTALSRPGRFQRFLGGEPSGFRPGETPGDLALAFEEVAEGVGWAVIDRRIGQASLHLRLLGADRLEAGLGLADLAPQPPLPGAPHGPPAEEEPQGRPV